MFPYENVMSIHNQKMAKFVAERDNQRLVRILNADQPSAVERMSMVFGRKLLALGHAPSEQNRRSAY